MFRKVLEFGILAVAIFPGSKTKLCGTCARKQPSMPIVKVNQTSQYFSTPKPDSANFNFCSKKDMSKTPRNNIDARKDGNSFNFCWREQQPLYYRNFRNLPCLFFPVNDKVLIGGAGDWSSGMRMHLLPSG
jgi:hypothetical protein